MVCTGKQGNPWAEVFVDIPARIGYIHPPLKLPGVRFLHTGLFPGRAGLSVPLGPVAYGTALSFFPGARFALPIEKETVPDKPSRGD